MRSTVGGNDPVLRSACSQRLTTMWVNRPLQVSQLGQLSLLSFRDRHMSSRPACRVIAALRGRLLYVVYRHITVRKVERLS